MNKREKEIVTKSIEIIKEYLNPPKILLFGSRAKGVNEKYADFDFAVEAQEPDINIQRRIKEGIESISGLYKFDIIYILSCDNKFKNIVLKTGEVIYERRD